MVKTTYFIKPHFARVVINLVTADKSSGLFTGDNYVPLPLCKQPNDFAV